MRYHLLNPILRKEIYMLGFKHLSFLSILLTSGLLSACQNQDHQTQEHAKVQDNTQNIQKIVVGFQKSSVNLLVARQEKYLEQQFPHASIEWKEFPAGPQMLEALAVGSIDYGYVGNTPPIFAQAADKALTYVGYEAYSGHNLALLTQTHRPLKTIQDLKGKRIAVQKGSSAHEFLAKILQKAGLTWQDIQPIWLAPADARAAFDKQSIDAWAIWDPFLANAQLTTQARVLIDANSFPQTYSFFIANPDFIQKHPEANQKFIDSMNQADRWIVQHPEETTKIYAQFTGLSPEVAQTVIDRRFKPSPVHLITPEVVKSQQAIADLFAKNALIPKKIDVQLHVWTPSTSHPSSSN